MERLDANNYARLCGTMAAAPAFSHSSRGLDFFHFPLTVERLSGNTDTLSILVRKEQLAALEPAWQDKLCVTGEVRNDRRAARHHRARPGARLL